jgi:hypothetical protein
MKQTVGLLANSSAALVRDVLRSFILTAGQFALVGMVLGVLSFLFLKDGHWLVALIVLVGSTMEGLLFGCFVAFKRSIASATATAIERLRLGQLTVSILFDRILKIAEDQPVGERGGWVARKLETMPLENVDVFFDKAVQGVQGDLQNQNWVRRRISTYTLQLVSAVTLKKFREQKASGGTINLLKTREDLEAVIDTLLVRRVRQTSRFWIMVMMAAFVGLLLLQTLIAWLILQIEV